MERILKGRGRRSFWRINALMWIVFAFLFFLRAHLQFDIRPAAALSVFQLVLCVLFSMALHFAYDRLRLVPGFYLRTCLWIISLSLLATLLQSTLTEGFIHLRQYPISSDVEADIWLLRTMFFWLVYLAWSCAHFWLRTEDIAIEREEVAIRAEGETQRMELQLLRSQLDPHFLLNALNGVATSIPSQPSVASSMVRELADYLRYTLDHRHDSVAPLRAELDSIQAYLQIEKTRFGDTLRVDYRIDEAARSRKVPCFLLQPLVENAFKHCFENTEPPWDLIVEATVKESTLFISIKNTGHLGTGTTRSGVGLETLRRRLALQYPDRYSFHLVEKQGMVCAELHLEGDPCLG